MADQTVHVGAGTVGTHAHFEARFVKVEGEVAGLKSDLGEIKALVKDIGDRFSAKGQINWAALALLAMILIPSLGWAWSQIGGLQTRIDNVATKFEVAIASVVADQKASLAAATAEQKAQSAQFESRAEITAKDGYVGQIGDLKAQLAAKDAAAVAAKVDRLAADVDALKGVLAPRPLHEQFWARQNDMNKSLEAQIDEVRKALASISPPSDALARLYKRLDSLEALARGGHTRIGE